MQLSLEYKGARRICEEVITNWNLSWKIKRKGILLMCHTCLHTAWTQAKDNWLEELIKCGGWKTKYEWHQGEDQFHLSLFDERLDLKETSQNVMMQENISKSEDLYQVCAGNKIKLTIAHYQNVNYHVLTHLGGRVLL